MLDYIESLAKQIAQSQDLDEIRDLVYTIEGVLDDIDSDYEEKTAYGLTNMPKKEALRLIQGGKV